MEQIARPFEKSTPRELVRPPGRRQSHAAGDSRSGLQPPNQPVGHQRSRHRVEPQGTDGGRKLRALVGVHDSDHGSSARSHTSRPRGICRCRRRSVRQCHGRGVLGPHVVHEQLDLHPCRPSPRRGDQMRDVPADGEAMGEVVMLGNSVMKGYLNDPAATTSAVTGGWSHSGDVGVMHPDGYVELRAARRTSSSPAGRTSQRSRSSTPSAATPQSWSAPSSRSPTRSGGSGRRRLSPSATASSFRSRRSWCCEHSDWRRGWCLANHRFQLAGAIRARGSGAVRSDPSRTWPQALDSLREGGGDRARNAA